MVLPASGTNLCGNANTAGQWLPLACYRPINGRSAARCTREVQHFLSHGFEDCSSSIVTATAAVRREANLLAFNIGNQA